MRRALLVLLLAAAVVVGYVVLRQHMAQYLRFYAGACG